MTDEPESLNPEASDERPDPGPTKRLEKAIEDMESGDVNDGTLVDIVAHTGEHPVAPEPSVTDALKQVKKGGPPPIQPAATMYEPTKPGQVSRGSTHATQFGPTGSQGNTPAMEGGTPQSGTMNAGQARPIAPFGGKIVVGTRFGQIEVTGVLGKGGMGEVFKGYHHALDINVAIKVLPDELSRNELVRQRFLREARLCVKLDHPHIVRVFNVDEYAGNLYLVMEMVDGTDAAHMLKNGGRFRYKRALEIGAGGADALAYAHSQGLVHRDVKPHNILLGASDGRIKLSDFGLARAATSSSHLTMSGQIMGTPHYMSPEQAESKEVSDKSDVYSLGVSLYHMLTGETPFVGDTPISVAVQHIAKEILYPEIRFKPFPKELVAVLKRMTAKDPAKRCSAKQAAVWLRKLITMAPADDIQLADEGAMKSMAPVVRESQAFEAAAKEREQRDFQARELARTMLATIQEDSARRPAVPQTMQESAQQYTSQAPAQAARGSGGLVAALIVIILLLAGGGAIGWYYTLGPGAAKDNSGPLLAGTNEDRENREPRTNGNSSNNTPPANSANSNADGGPSNSDGGVVTDDGGIITDDGGPTDGGTPPAEVDDPLVESALKAVAISISDASSLADLDEAKKKLAQAKMEMPKASQRQRDEYDALAARYNRQRAYLASSEGFDRIRNALAGFDEKRGSDHRAAIVFLNTAIKERDALALMKVPPEAEELIATDRDALTEKVNAALKDFWDEVDTDAKRLETAELFPAAESLLLELTSINHSAEKVGEANQRLQSVRIRGIHKGVRDDLAIPDFKHAMELLDRAKEFGVPEALKTEHEKVVASVGKAIEEKLDSHVNSAITAADRGEFTAARDLRDLAVALPGTSADQRSRVADLVVYIDLSQHVRAAETALNGSSLAEAHKSIGEADRVVAAATGRTISQNLTDRLIEARRALDRAVASKFEGLLASARTDMEDKDFEAAGRSLAEADNLPLSETQRATLEEFKVASQTALADFVRGLITDIEKALDAGDFDVASARLDTADSLPIPDDMKEKLTELRRRCAIEAVKRHGDLLEAARGALEKRDYAAARTALDSAAKVPVSSTETDKATALEKEYTSLLTAAAEEHFKKATELLEEGKYKEAKAELDAAAALPLNEDLARKLRNHREAWKTAVDKRLSKLVKQAEEARAQDLYGPSDQHLKEAQELPLNNDQLVTLGIARDRHDADVSAYKDKLFKQLEDHVAKGNEKEGRKVADKLEAVGLLTAEHLRLKRLLAALTGETDSVRMGRLPAHLKKLWDDRYCRPEQVIKVGEEVTAVAVTTDGKVGAAGTASGKVTFYNLKRGTQIGTSSGGRKRVTAIAISADGNSAACGNDDGQIALFDLSGGTVQASDLPTAGDDVFGLAFTSNGAMLYAVTRDGQVHQYNPRTKGKLGAGTASGLDGANCVDLSPDDKWLAIGGGEGEIAVFELPRMVLKETLDGPGDDNVQRVAFSANSGQLISASIDDGVGVWDMKKLTKKPTKEYKGLSEWARGAGFSSDGRRCAAFDNEQRLVVWDTKSGLELRRLDYGEKLAGEKDFFVTAGVIGPDGTVLIGTREGGILHMSLKTAG